MARKRASNLMQAVPIVGGALVGATGSYFSGWADSKITPNSTGAFTRASTYIDVVGGLAVVGISSMWVKSAGLRNFLVSAGATMASVRIVSLVAEMMNTNGANAALNSRMRSMRAKSMGVNRMRGSSLQPSVEDVASNQLVQVLG